MKKFILILSFLIILTLAFAGNYRINGMGGAGLALINDIKTVTYNPSLMGNLKSTNLRVLGVDYTMNKNMLDLVQQLSDDATVTRLINSIKGDLSKGEDSSDEDIGEDLTYLLKNYSLYLNNDSFMDMELNSGLVFNFKIVQIGIGANTNINALMNFDTANLAVDTFNVNAKTKTGVALSTGLQFLRVGIGIYDVAALGYNIEQGTSVTDIATDIQNNPPKLINTVAGDLSATLQLGAFRMSAVSRNAITSYSKAYSLDNLNNVPINQDIQDMVSKLTINSTNLQNNLDLGVAFVQKGFALSAQIDNFHGFLDRVNNGPTSENLSLVRYLHFGIEKSILPFLTLRAGVNQGYLTFGGDVFLVLGRVGFAYYGSEAGMIAGDQIRQNFEVHADVLF